MDDQGIRKVCHSGDQGKIVNPSPFRVRYKKESMLSRSQPNIEVDDEEDSQGYIKDEAVTSLLHS